LLFVAVAVSRGDFASNAGDAAQELVGFGNQRGLDDFAHLPTADIFQDGHVVGAIRNSRRRYGS